MKYKGIEIKEITDDIPNLPKKMLVWGNLTNTEDDVCERVVLASVLDANGTRFIIAQQSSGLSGVCIWNHCADIPKEESRLVTNRELAEWLSKGYGEYRTGGIIFTNYCYHGSKQNDYVSSDLTVRKFGEEEWNKPTLEYFTRP